MRVRGEGEVGVAAPQVDEVEGALPLRDRGQHRPERSDELLDLAVLVRTSRLHATVRITHAELAQERRRRVDESWLDPVVLRGVRYCSPAENRRAAGVGSARARLR